MKYSDGKREHRVEEDREGREYRSEGARGARDINRSNRDRANIAFGSMVNGNNQELSVDMESGSLESAEQGEKSEPQNKESCSCQAKGGADVASREGEEEGVTRVTESGSHQQVTDVEGDEKGEAGWERSADEPFTEVSASSKESDISRYSGDTVDENSEGRDDDDENSEGAGEAIHEDREVSEGVESDEEGEESGSDGDEEDEEQSKSYTYNTQQVFKISQLGASSSELRYRFYNFIEKIAEEETKVEDPRGYDRYSMKMLMMRRYTKKPLKSCMVSRVRDQVVLILDNSGSMDWWKENILEIADVAMKRKDVEIYIAPNGFIESRIENGEEVLVSDEEREELMKMTGRTIIYVGDFDGADTPIQLSWRNKVYWFCPESRYRRFRSHSWVNYGEEHFKGTFIRCWNLEEFMDSLTRITNYRRMFIDYHELHTFEDDLS